MSSTTPKTGRPAMSKTQQARHRARQAAGSVLGAAADALFRNNPLLAPIAGIGFAISFQTIAHEATAHHMPGYPILYPILIDLGFAGMVIEARRAIQDGRSDLVPRLLAWLLGFFTIYVNAHGSARGDWVGLSMHVCAPVLWIAFLELGRWRQLHRKRAADQVDKIPLARWVFEPRRTAGMRKRMVVHHVTKYKVAVAREEALMMARDLVRAETGKRWRKCDVAVLRHHLSNGTLPEAVSDAAETASFGRMPSMAEPVTEWVIDALTAPGKTASKIRAQKARIESSNNASDEGASDTPRGRQKAGQRPVSQREQKRRKVLRLLDDPDGLTRDQIAAKAGVSVSTVDRIKSERVVAIDSRRKTG